jgi:hypothetical protein
VGGRRTPRLPACRRRWCWSSAWCCAADRRQRSRLLSLVPAAKPVGRPSGSRHKRRRAVPGDGLGSPAVGHLCVANFLSYAAARMVQIPIKIGESYRIAVDGSIPAGGPVSFGCPRIRRRLPQTKARPPALDPLVPQEPAAGTRTTKSCKVLGFRPSHQSTRHGRSGPRGAGHPCLTSTPRPLPTRATHTNHDPIRRFESPCAQRHDRTMAHVEVAPPPITHSVTLALHDAGTASDRRHDRTFCAGRSAGRLAVANLW